MDGFTGKFFRVDNCERFGQSVNVLEYRKEDSGWWSNCEICGQKLRRHWWTVQTVGDDLVIGDVGPECVKKLKGVRG